MSDRAAERTAGTEGGPGQTIVAPRPYEGRSQPPHPLNPLIGRERELAAIRDLLLRPGLRILTLVGPGGVGKTRLAIEAVTRASAEFDAVAYVELASIREPELVLPAIAHRIGPRESGEDPLSRLGPVLRNRRFLLVLDNFEQVLTAAPAVAALAAAFPALKVLVTSRSVLRVSGERAFPVSPLGLPSATADSSDDTLAADAVQLFAERATAADPFFAVTEPAGAAIVAICRRLDGLPLAIELAAARVRLFPPVTLLARLERRLPLLTDGPRDAPERQQTMRDAIAWSYDLLAPEEQALFRRLAVFVGGSTIEAAEVVGGAGDGASVLGGVAALLEHSLLHREEGPGGEPRFRMLETVREFGLEQLERAGETEEIRDCHAADCVASAHHLTRQFRGPDQILALDRYEADHDNARVALAWLLDRGDVAAAAQLADALHWFWYLRGHWQEGRRRLEEMLALPSETLSAVHRGRFLVAAGLFAFRLGDHATAHERFATGVETSRAVGDRWTVAWGLHQLGWIFLLRGDIVLARDRLEESVRDFREMDKPWGTPIALSSLGLALALTDDPCTFAVLDESIELARAQGDTWSLARCYEHIGDAARAAGNTDQARVAFEESLQHLRQLGFVNAGAVALFDLGSVALADGNPRSAASRFVEALDLHIEHGDRQGIANVLAGLAKTAWRLQRPEAASRLIGAAQAQFDVIGVALWPVDQAEVDKLIADLRRTLGASAFTASWDEGQVLSTEAAIAVARAIAAEAMNVDATPAVSPETLRLGLTPREVAVLRLLAQRLTDREIAAELFISPKTAGNHVSNILAKLGAADRREAAAIAAQLGLA